MKKTLLSTLVMAFVAGMGATGGAGAAGPATKHSSATEVPAGTPSYMIGTGSMTSNQRGDLARDFVKKWGPYFHATYQQPVDGWAQAQARVIGTADLQNLRAAMSKTTLEAAMMTMRGHQVSDDQAIDFLARQPTQQRGALPASLGDLAKDLVYTPLTPCRVFDTRNTGTPIGSGSSRAMRLYLHGTDTGFEAQGGQANTDCGLIPEAAAVALNVAAPLSEVGGFLTVYPFNTARPLSSSLDYRAGELQNNEIVAKTATSTFEVTVYAHGRTHVVADVVGYYAAPAATALDCTRERKEQVAAAGAITMIQINCPIGYFATGAGGLWEYSNNKGDIVMWPNSSASGRTFFTVMGTNEGTGPQTLYGYTICCRIPGR